MSRVGAIRVLAVIAASVLVGVVLVGAIAAAAQPVTVRTIPAAVDATPVPSPTAAARVEPAKWCATFRKSFADRLGVTEDALVEAAKGAAIDTIDQALADGVISPEVAERLETRVAEADNDVCSAIAKKRLDRRVAPAVGARGLLDKAAEVLKLTPADLRAKLGAGASLEAIAMDQGLAYADVSAAIVAKVKADLDKAVADGRLRQARADKVLDRITNALADGSLLRGKRGG